MKPVIDHIPAAFRAGADQERFAHDATQAL